MSAASARKTFARAGLARSTSRIARRKGVSVGFERNDKSLRKILHCLDERIELELSFVAFGFELSDTSVSGCGI